MITQLRTKNFKSWEDTGDLTIAPLTGFFGTNSSGKSSILQLLLMLKQTVESSDRSRVLHTGDEKSLVDLGTFYDLIYHHKDDISLEVGLSWKMPERLIISDPKNVNENLFIIYDLIFKTIIKGESGKPSVESFIYAFFDHKKTGEHSFGMKKKEENYELSSLGKYRPKRFKGRVWSLPSPLKFYGFPDEVRGYFQNTGFLSDIVLEFEKLFSRIAYLGPLREYPKRSYIWAGEEPVDVGSKGERAIPALLASRQRGKTSSPCDEKKKETVEEIIAYWLKEMGLIDSYSLKPVAKNRKDYELRVKKTPTSPEVLITDVGFGVSQILPILVLCYYMPEGSIIILEQPEIHLHPSVQSWLADVFIHVVTHRNIQLIIESHSEHLLRRLQRRIAEEKIKTESTALYFCRMENSSSKIEKLDVDSDGYITNWPNDFFGNEIEDIARMTEAAMNKSMKGKKSS